MAQKENIDGSKTSEYSFFKYEECDVENKDILYKDINVNYNNLLNFLSKKN